MRRSVELIGSGMGSYLSPASLCCHIGNPAYTGLEPRNALTSCLSSCAILMKRH